MRHWLQLNVVLQSGLSEGVLLDPPNSIVNIFYIEAKCKTLFFFQLAEGKGLFSEMSVGPKKTEPSSSERYTSFFLAHKLMLHYPLLIYYSFNGAHTT